MGVEIPATFATTTICVFFFTKKGVILAKKTYLTTYQGWKEENREKQMEKNLLNDLPGVKRRKMGEKMAKKTYLTTYQG